MKVAPLRILLTAGAGFAGAFAGYVGGAAWIGVSFNDQDDNMPLILEYGLPVVAFALSILAGRWLSRRAEEQ